MGTLRILSRSSQAFADRIEAGRQLALELKDLQGKSAVVLGIPRGGMIVARELAAALQADLDMVIARKIGAPGNPELAIGAISEDGNCFLDERVISLTRSSAAYIDRAKAGALAELRRRASLYRQVRPQVPLADRTVVVTDDGVATGSTMQASLWSARQEKPVKLIAALPVGPEETLTSLAEYADEVLCLRAPPFFDAVGRFYVHFDQTSDDELIEVLHQEAKRHTAEWH